MPAAILSMPQLATQNPASVIFFSRFQTAIEQQFKEKMVNIFGHLATPGQQPTDDDMRSLMFGDYMTKKEEDRLYDEVQHFEELGPVRALIFPNDHIDGKT